MLRETAPKEWSLEAGGCGFTGSEGADVTCYGRLFNTREYVTEFTHRAWKQVTKRRRLNRTMLLSFNRRLKCTQSSTKRNTFQTRQQKTTCQSPIHNTTQDIVNVLDERSCDWHQPPAGIDPIWYGGAKPISHALSVSCTSQGRI